MSDDRSTPGTSPGAICPWCSAVLGAADIETCPSCGATLHTDAEPAVPGVTQIDPMAVIEGTRPPRQQKNRLMAWITGDEGPGPESPETAAAIAPPPPEVRLEMLRLQMEAELAQASAEAEAMATDEALAADAEGDQATAKAAVDAVMDADARTDELVESPEEFQAAQEEAADAPGPVGGTVDRAEAGAPAEGTAPANGATPA